MWNKKLSLNLKNQPFSTILKSIKIRENSRIHHRVNTNLPLEFSPISQKISHIKFFSRDASKSSKNIPYHKKGKNLNTESITLSANQNIKRKKNIHMHKYGFQVNQNEKYRETMEDRILIKDNLISGIKSQLFCIFDGHGGDKTVKLCEQLYPDILKKCLDDEDLSFEESIKKSFKLMDLEISKYNDLYDQGNTATVVLIIEEVLYCANVGDSSCFLVNKREAKKISIDDNFNDINEIKRVNKIGGKILNKRLEGSLAVSRALGDFILKNRGLSSEPHVYQKRIDENMKYCVLASDGVWDVLTQEDLFNLCSFHQDPQTIAENIIEKSLLAGTTDNLSCIVIDLDKTKRKVKYFLLNKLLPL